MKSLLAVLCLVLAPTLALGWDYKQSGSDWRDGTCAAEGLQSPINIEVPAGTGGADSDELRVFYPVLNAWEAGLRVVHTGSAIQVSGKQPMGSMTYRGRTYVAKEVLFKAPAEHQIRGRQYPLEIQIVHQAQNAEGEGDTLVISALYRMKAFTEARSSQFLNEVLFWDRLPVSKGKRTLLHGQFQLGSALSGLHAGYFRYHGSTTQPPCATGVVWHVLETVQEASAGQILRINNIFKNNQAFAFGKGNNRAVQPLGSRRVALHNHKPRGDSDGRPIPLALTSSAENNPSTDGQTASPEDLPVADYSKPNPERRPGQPDLYQWAARDWSGICRTGRMQSPINIQLAVGNPHGDFEMSTNYGPSNASFIKHLGWTLEVLGNFGNITIGEEGDMYQAERLLFHTPAEHTVDGRRAALELEIVHRKMDQEEDEYAIVSVLFYKSLRRRSRFLNSLTWRKLPSERNAYVTLPNLVNLNLLRGMRKGYYSYAGSLSYPPCTEGVKRFVMRTYNAVSEWQLEQIRRLFKYNYRPLQQPNGRGVMVHNVNIASDAVPPM